MIKINFDGACGPQNPGGKCGGGAVIIKDNKLLKEIAEEYIPMKMKETSNNVGEYFGLIKALEYLIDEGYSGEVLDIYGDSNLVIQQMSDNWKIKKGIYKDLALRAKRLILNFERSYFTWIPREQNEWADNLSKKAIGGRILVEMTDIDRYCYLNQNEI